MSDLREKIFDIIEDLSGGDMLAGQQNNENQMNEREREIPENIPTYF
jgi:hypothetical protein